jgi:hypothetical protein
LQYTGNRKEVQLRRKAVTDNIEDHMTFPPEFFYIY